MVYDLKIISRQVPIISGGNFYSGVFDHCRLRFWDSFSVQVSSPGLPARHFGARLVGDGSQGAAKARGEACHLSRRMGRLAMAYAYVSLHVDMFHGDVSCVCFFLGSWKGMRWNGFFSWFFRCCQHNWRHRVLKVWWTQPTANRDAFQRFEGLVLQRFADLFDRKIESFLAELLTLSTLSDPFWWWQFPEEKDLFGLRHWTSHFKLEPFSHSSFQLQEILAGETGTLSYSYQQINVSLGAMQSWIINKVALDELDINAVYGG